MTVEKHPVFRLNVFEIFEVKNLKNPIYSINRIFFKSLIVENDEKV
jgi:hypothetical protein